MLTLGNLIVDPDYRQAHALRGRVRRVLGGLLLALAALTGALWWAQVPGGAILVAGGASVASLLAVAGGLGGRLRWLRRRAERRFRTAVRDEIDTRYGVQVPASLIPVSAHVPEYGFATTRGGSVPVTLEFFTTLQEIHIDGLGAGVPTRWWAAA